MKKAETAFVSIISTLREKCPNTEFFSGPYFPVLGLNTEIYGGILQIQSEYSKTQTRRNFSRSAKIAKFCFLGGGKTCRRTKEQF